MEATRPAGLAERYSSWLPTRLYPINIPRLMPRRRPQSDEDADKLSSVETATALRSAGELAQIHPEERVGSIGSLVGSPYRALGVSQEERPDPDALRLFVLEDFLPRMGADVARVPSARRRMTPSLARQHLTHGFLIRADCLSQTRWRCSPSIVVSAALCAIRPLTAVPAIVMKPPMATPATPIQATSMTVDTRQQHGSP